LATTTSNNHNSVLTKLTQAKNNTEQACAGSQRRCTETPTTQSRCVDGKWSGGSTRHHAHQTVPIPRTVAPQHDRSLGPRLQEGGPSYRRAEPVLPNTTPLCDGCTCEICWRAASKHTTDDTPTCQCATMRQDVPHGLHQTLHTTTLKMKQNSGDARLAATPTTQPRTLSGARLGALGDGRKPLRGPRYGSSNQEWNTVYKDQPHTPEQTHSTRTSPTVSKECGRMQGKVDHTRTQPVRSKLIAGTNPRAWAEHPLLRALEAMVKNWYLSPMRRIYGGPHLPIGLRHSARVARAAPFARDLFPIRCGRVSVLARSGRAGGARQRIIHRCRPAG
jgi:hypothetical protein